MYPTRNRNGARARHAQGFSLVELMVAMAIAMVVLAAILSSYTFLGRNLVRYSNQQQLEAQSRRMLQILGEDVRMADNIAYAYDPTKDIKQDSTWQTLPTALQASLRLGVPNSSGGTYVYAVTYVYDTNAGVLRRTVSSGVSSGAPPSGFNASPLILLTGLPKVGDAGPLWTGLRYFDQQDLAAANTLSIKKIEIASFTISAGTATTGTRSFFNGASARLVLRNKQLVHIN